MFDAASGLVERGKRKAEWQKSDALYKRYPKFGYPLGADISPVKILGVDDLVLLSVFPGPWPYVFSGRIEPAGRFSTVWRLEYHFFRQLRWKPRGFDLRFKSILRRINVDHLYNYDQLRTTFQRVARSDLFPDGPSYVAKYDLVASAGFYVTPENFKTLSDQLVELAKSKDSFWTVEDSVGSDNLTLHCRPQDTQTKTKKDQFSGSIHLTHDPVSNVYRVGISLITKDGNWDLGLPKPLEDFVIEYSTYIYGKLKPKVEPAE